MKSTGVVRRIDDLGRIVIPKEIRRTLRIRDGENLEIFVDKEMITLKKISKMTDLEDISKELVEIINNNINKDVLITDRDKFIACSGNFKKNILNKNISLFLENILNERKYIIEKNNVELSLSDDLIINTSYIIQPIIVNGDILGILMILSQNGEFSSSDEKLANITVQFLEKHIEE